jgi:hypothetical protein
MAQKLLAFGFSFLGFYDFLVGCGSFFGEEYGGLGRTPPEQKTGYFLMRTFTATRLETPDTLMDI